MTHQSPNDQAVGAAIDEVIDGAIDAGIGLGIGAPSTREKPDAPALTARERHSYTR